MKERANDGGDDGDDTTLARRGGVPERVQDYDIARTRDHRTLAGLRTHELGFEPYFTGENNKNTYSA